MSEGPDRTVKLRRVVGRNIRVERAQAGMTQVQLAAAASVNRGFLSLVERGGASPSIDWIGQIAAALGVPAARLLLEDPPGS